MHKEFKHLTTGDTFIMRVNIGMIAWVTVLGTNGAEDDVVVGVHVPPDSTYSGWQLAEDGCPGYTVKDAHLKPFTYGWYVFETTYYKIQEQYANNPIPITFDIKPWMNLISPSGRLEL